MHDMLQIAFVQTVIDVTAMQIAAKEGKFGLPSRMRRMRYLEYPSREPHTDELGRIASNAV